MIPSDKLYEILRRFEFIEAKLSDNPEGHEIAALTREYTGLKPIAELIRLYHSQLEQIKNAKEMLADPEMKRLAEEELAELEAALPDIEQHVRVALIPKDSADSGSAIVEVRAGTGGDEAALFAGNLISMYQRYAEKMGWKFEVMESAETELGGYKEIIAAIKGDGVFARLKFESGVHRVQRVPVTESGGRIHTSAATVAVLAEAQDVDIEINQNDIRIDTMRASGAGGQHVNTTDSAVRITHLPTGIVVTSSEKSQHQNRARAMEVLKAKLYDLERQKANDERAAERKGQVGSGDRSERIRTYNFPQGRMTDHRINLTLYKLEQILQGDLEEVSEALIAADQAEKLAEMDVK